MFGRASLAAYCTSIAALGLLTACALDVNGTGPDIGGASGSAGSSGSTGSSGSSGSIVQPGLDASTVVVHDAGGSGSPDTGSGVGKDATTPAPDSGPPVTVDASSPPPPDTGANTTPDTGTTGPVDSGTCTPGDNGCVSVPNGWTVVAFSEVRTSACPTGFRQTTTDVVEGPDTSNACSCGTCDVSSNPTCTTGAIELLSSTAFSQGPPCSTSSVLQNDMPGTCQQISPLSAGPPLTEVEFIPPPAAGGVCSAPGQKQANNVAYRAQGRLCGADNAESTACSTGTCSPTVDSPYSICLMQAGNVPCPAGLLDVPHLVGTTADFSCGDCGCDLTADCAGTIQFFTDMNCQMQGAVSNVNSTCRPAGPTDGLIAYEYDPDPATNVACTTAGGSTASSPTLETETTVCCAQ